ncbi:MAG: cupin domain-containing protein [Solirubrobacteraceae bacterium]
MPGEARLEQGPSGLAPAAPGWFVVNVSDAAWSVHPRFGASCGFESRESAPFAEVGINVRVLNPGQPTGMYHSESHQEGFLVLAGEALLGVDGQERPLRAWDFFHCPAGTDHILVGAGDGPCVLLAVGDRATERSQQGLHYPASELAERWGASVPKETNDPREAYADVAWPEPGHPEAPGLPWRA